MQDEVTIILTTPEALLFRDYQKHHDLFAMLQQKGVFDIEFGKCTLNFAFGQLQNCVKEEVVWKK